MHKATSLVARIQAFANCIVCGSECTSLCSHPELVGSKYLESKVVLSDCPECMYPENGTSNLAMCDCGFRRLLGNFMEPIAWQIKTALHFNGLLFR